MNIGDKITIPSTNAYHRDLRGQSATIVEYCKNEFMNIPEPSLVVALDNPIHEGHFKCLHIKQRDWHLINKGGAQ